MPERVLICGSRDWTDGYTIARAIEQLPPDATVIHGGARGADTLADIEAQVRGLAVEVYKADWQTHGRAAGPIRNRRMLEEGKPGRVIAFRNHGASPGTDNMIRQAKAAGLPVEVHEPETMDEAIARHLKRRRASAPQSEGE